MDDFDRVVDLEGEFYRQGVAAGIEAGLKEGLEEGERMGFSKGFALASEVGFYLGVLDTLLLLSGGLESNNTGTEGVELDAKSPRESEEGSFISEKTRRTLENLKSLALLLDENGTLQIEVMEQLHTIRSKFKLICAQMGLKLKYSGTTIDKVAEAELPAGIPSVDF